MRITALSIVLVMFSTSVFAAYDDVCTQNQYKIPMRPSTPTADFDVTVSNGNVLIDNRYGLMWMRCVVGESFDPVNRSCEGDTASGATNGSWRDALGMVNTANTNMKFGFEGWRMPNIKELMSLVEHQCSHPAMNTYLFPGASGYSVWSNTPASADEFPITDTKIRYVNFFTGSVGAEKAGSSDLYIRLVRDYVAP